MIGNYHFPSDYGCPAPGMPLCRKQSRRNRDAPMWSSFREFEACERTSSILLLFGVPPPPISFRKFVIFMGVAYISFRCISLRAPEKQNARGVRAFLPGRAFARFHSSRRVKYSLVSAKSIRCVQPRSRISTRGSETLVPVSG